MFPTWHACGVLRNLKLFANPSNAQVGKTLENCTPRGRVFKQFKISECGDCVIIRISISGEMIKSFHPDDCCVAK